MFSENTFETPPTLSEESKIVFVSDFFIDDYVGGAELTTDAIIKSCPVKYDTLKSNEVTMELLRSGYEKYWVFGNFANLNFDLILDASELMFDVVNRMDQKKYNTTSYERIPPRISFANRYEKNLCNESVPNFLPVPFFTGPIFLSKHGLYVDWQDDPDLNRIIEKIMISINGVNTCYDIAKYCGVKAKVVSDYLKKFEEKGLIRSEEVKV